MESRIRKISIDKLVETNSTVHTHTMNYIVNGVHPIRLEGDEKPTKMHISSIEKTDINFVIYVQNGDEVQKWKSIPREGVSVEYFID